MPNRLADPLGHGWRKVHHDFRLFVAEDDTPAAAHTLTDCRNVLGNEGTTDSRRGIDPIELESPHFAVFLAKSDGVDRSAIGARFEQVRVEQRLAHPLNLL